MIIKDGVIKAELLDQGILQITLNRSEYLNALSHEMLQALSYTFEYAKKESVVKAILLAGAGKGFCAGADIKQLAVLNGMTGRAFAEYGQAVFNQLEQLGKPSLAAISGFALGGGCELAMSATLRMAATNAVFGQPEIKLGIIPGFGGTQRLARLIGKGRALELCLTGRRFSAEEALHWGFISEMVVPDQLLNRALSILQELLTLSATALQSMIAVIDQGYDLPLPQALALEAMHFGLCCTTQDKQEGVMAFLEKRQPQFHGQ